jgi:hypothetical protein
MGVWQGVAIDSLKFHPGLPCPALVRPAGEPARNGLMAVLGMARPLNGWLEVVFYPFGHPVAYVYAERRKCVAVAVGSVGWRELAG